MKLKIKSSEVNKIVELDNSAKLEQLLGVFAETEVVSIKNGFPPKSIDLTDITKTLTELNVKNGDQLIVEFNKNPKRPLEEDATINKESKHLKLIVDKTPVDADDIANAKCGSGYAILRNIADDNSCMFNSILYCMFGKDHSLIYPPHKLRSIVKDEILSNPIKYSEIILGRPRDKYVDWIMRDESWGGAIELGIIAQEFSVQIIAIDVESGNFIKFNEDAGNLMVLIYSGIHYDAVAYNSILSLSETSSDKCVFGGDDELGREFLDSCKTLTKLLQSRHYSTNTTTFRVKCLDCGEILVGEMGASKHANKKNHFNFGEVNK